MVDTNTIEKLVFDLCVEANTDLPGDVVQKIYKACENETSQEAKQALAMILQNAKMAHDKKMPLCQDTGQVIIIARGNDFPQGFEDAVKRGVEKAYKEYPFRKSIVKNALFDRTNTKTNIPCVIYTELSDSQELEIDVLIKGAGCENVGAVEMLSPTATEEEVIEYVCSVIKKAGSKGCPPYFLGIGIGGTMEHAALLSKKALILKKNLDEQHEKFAKRIQDAVNRLNIGAAGLGGASTCLDVKLLTDFTHIACMPVAVTVNCHSARHAKWAENEKEEMGKCKIEWESIKDFVSQLTVQSPQKEDHSTIHLLAHSHKIDASDIKALKSLKVGDNILLSGKIYTARDMAHKRLLEMIKNGDELPFDLKNSIIFYAGPCPCKGDCVVGSIGPTTASRMDKFASAFYERGVLATIGKGERCEEVKASIRKNGGIYFTMIGGIACLMSEKFVKKEIVAFPELGTEAVYGFEVKDLPIRVSFK